MASLAELSIIFDQLEKEPSVQKQDIEQLKKDTAEYLYERYPDQDEGFLTRLKTKIENGESLGELSKNLGAISILKRYSNKICWDELCGNPTAIDMIKVYFCDSDQNIDWRKLSKNPAAIELLKANPDKIDWNE